MSALFAFVGLLLPPTGVTFYIVVWYLHCDAMLWWNVISLVWVLLDSYECKHEHSPHILFSYSIGFMGNSTWFCNPIFPIGVCNSLLCVSSWFHLNCWASVLWCNITLLPSTALITNLKLMVTCLSRCITFHTKRLSAPNCEFWAF